jgi:hypothetical protein
MRIPVGFEILRQTFLDRAELGVGSPLAAFLALVPEAAQLPRGEVSARVNPMIAAAINSDPPWFWHGLDA